MKSHAGANARGGGASAGGSGRGRGTKRDASILRALERTLERLQLLRHLLGEGEEKTRRRGRIGGHMHENGRVRKMHQGEAIVEVEDGRVGAKVHLAALFRRRAK